MKHNEVLETMTPPDLVIAALGGVRAAARVLACDPATVSRWRKAGHIPAHCQRRVLEAVWSKGVDITAYELIFGRPAA